MRGLVPIALAALAACGREPPIRADLGARPIASVETREAPTTQEPPPDQRRFEWMPTMPEQDGLVGTLELWRDARLDQAWLEHNWKTGTFGAGRPLPEGFSLRPRNARLVLRDEAGKILDTMEVDEPVATLSASAPWHEVATDTYHDPFDPWAATTHRFVRVEAGHLHTSPCATVYQCKKRCGFWLEDAGGGLSLRVYRDFYDAADERITHLDRIRVDDTCKTTSKTRKGWADGQFMSSDDWPA